MKKTTDSIIPAIIIGAIYLAAQMMSDVASLRIVNLWGFSIDGGTLVYPLTFTLRDMVHKSAGIRAARFLILVAALINILMAGLFWLIAQLPADMQVGAQAEFGMVLAPVWRIVFASVVAEVVSELVDTEGYRLWVEKVTHRYQWLRVLVSNSISVPLDSLIFCWLAFGGAMPTAVVWSIVLSNIIVKYAMTLISLPGIYLVRD